MYRKQEKVLIKKCNMKTRAYIYYNLLVIGGSSTMIYNLLVIGGLSLFFFLLFLLLLLTADLID